MVWLYDCYHWALLWENFTPAGCGFGTGACSCCRCSCRGISTVSTLQEVVACGGCRDRTNVGRKAREGPGVVTTWGVKDGDVSNLEVLSSYFGLGGRMKHQFRFFLILCFWMLVKKGCSCSFFGLEVIVRWCTASSLLLVALASTISPFFEDPC